MSDPARVARAWVEAWNGGERERFYAMMHPDIEWRDRPEFPDAGVSRGREAVRRHVEQLTESVDVHWEVLSLETAGERALLHVRLTLRGEGSGLATEQELHAVVTVRDGLVARRENYSSREQALRALGRT